MNLLPPLPRNVVLALLGLALPYCAQAAPVVTSFMGNLGADNSVISDPFTVSSPATYTFTTTSYASGGIVPVLSLFNTITGGIVDFSGVNTGFSDVSITDTLGSGSYVLDLTEFPNVANGNLTAGFFDNLFGDAATITGDLCGVSGGMFYNTVTCGKTTSSYAFTSTANVAATPEPATWALLLGPGGLLMVYGRRFSRA